MNFPLLSSTDGLATGVNVWPYAVKVESNNARISDRAIFMNMPSVGQPVYGAKRASRRPNFRGEWRSRRFRSRRDRLLIHPSRDLDLPAPLDRTAARARFR